MALIALPITKHLHAGPADGNSAYAGHYQHYMSPSMRQSTAENPLTMEQFDTPPGYREDLPYESYVDNWGGIYFGGCGLRCGGGR